MTNGFVTNAVLIEKAVSCWHLHQLISQTVQYLDSWLSDLLQSELKCNCWKTRGHVPQCPIAGDATGLKYYTAGYKLRSYVRIAYGTTLQLTLHYRRLNIIVRIHAASQSRPDWTSGFAGRPPWATKRTDLSAVVFAATIQRTRMDGSSQPRKGKGASAGLAMCYEKAVLPSIFRLADQPGRLRVAVLRRKDCTVCTDGGPSRGEAERAAWRYMPGQSISVTHRRQRLARRRRSRLIYPCTLFRSAQRRRKHKLGSRTNDMAILRAPIVIILAMIIIIIIIIIGSDASVWNTRNCDQLMHFSQWQLRHTATKVSSVSFLIDLGRKISERTGEPLEVQFLFQRISVLIQRFNSVLFHETFPVEDDTDT